MEIGLYEAVSGMKAQASLQDTIASNLSRMSLPGNKRTMVAFEIPKDSPLQQGAIPGMTRRLGMKGAPLQARTVTDFTPAPLEHTGGQFDLGIIGDGFFKIREANGNFSYTRDGQFHLTNEGKLVTLDGAEVLGNNDSPIQIAMKDSQTVQIDGHGKVFTGDGRQRVSSNALSVVHFDEPRTVLTLGAPNGRFVADASAKPEQFLPGLPKNGQIMQGSLESSNATAVNEMVSMVNVVRAYEASQKLASAEDSLTGDIVHALNDT